MLSIATESSGARVPQPTATSGTSVVTPASASSAGISEAMTMIPSTPWPRNRSTASCIERRSNADRLAMLTE